MVNGEHRQTNPLITLHEFVYRRDATSLAVTVEAHAHRANSLSCIAALVLQVSGDCLCSVLAPKQTYEYYYHANGHTHHPTQIQIESLNQIQIESCA